MEIYSNVVLSATEL